MIDIKKASKQELVDLLMVDACAIEDMIDVRKSATYINEYGNECPLFISGPERKIHVHIKLFMRLAEIIKPEIIVIPREIREGGEYSKRKFIMELCGHKYEIFMLYTEKEGKEWNLDF